MKNLKFTLTAGDIEVISDALVNDGKHQELIQMFSVIELMSSEIKISVVNKKESIHKFSELLEDLSLDLDNIVQNPQPNVVETTNIPTNMPKLVRVPEPQDESEPAAVNKNVIVGWDERVPKPSYDPEFVGTLEPSQESLPEEAHTKVVSNITDGWSSKKPSGWSV